MSPEQAEKSPFDPFDDTKVWPHGQYPLIPVGKFVLNRNPENYFAEIEQIGFDPAHLIPGENLAIKNVLYKIYYHKIIFINLNMYYEESFFLQELNHLQTECCKVDSSPTATPTVTV